MTAQPQSSPDYDEFAEQLIAEGILTDPWFEGRPRFDAAPVVVSRQAYQQMVEVAEQVTAAVQEACQLCADKPELLEDFLALTPYQRLQWASSAPAWHGFARVDLFETERGLLACEINADTPTGQPEAVLLNRHVRDRYPNTLDPNEGMEDRLSQLFELLTTPVLGEGFERTLGLVYPTELTEDLPLIRAYQTWLEARGWKVILGSPYNLGIGPDGRVQLFGQPCNVILRHYKTDWWGERITNWVDEEPYPDAEPLRDQLGILIEAAIENRCVIVNPFGAVVAQNKRTFALLWENLHLLSDQAQQAVRTHIPRTLRLESVHREQLSAEKDRWVLKSDYGCEGSEVILGPLCTQELWDQSLEKARPGHWIAQEYFQAEVQEHQEVRNYGVYLFGGEAAGLYLRVNAGATDVHARSVPVLVAKEES